MVKLRIPWQVYAVVGTVAVFFLWGGLQFRRGEAATQKLWDAAKASAQATADGLTNASQNVTTQVEIRYVDKIVTVREKGDVVIREVPVYIPASSCPLPGGFRLLHDAAATNTIPEATRIPYAAPVPAQDATRTVAENYRTCHEVRVNLEALQGWVKDQRQVYLDACKQQPALCSADTVE
jgi:hypothetical protein